MTNGADKLYTKQSINEIKAYYDECASCKEYGALAGSQTISFLVNGLVYTTMAFIMSKFIHFILKFRYRCKEYCSMLVVHSQFKITLSPVMVQAFLSQSICLLTNISNCKLTFLFFLCLTYTLAQTHEKKHKLHSNHAFNP